MLQHENIVTFYESFRLGDSKLYICMEELLGGEVFNLVLPPIIHTCSELMHSVLNRNFAPKDNKLRCFGLLRFHFKISNLFKRLQKEVFSQPMKLAELFDKFFPPWNTCTALESHIETCTFLRITNSVNVPPRVRCCFGVDRHVYHGLIKF